MIVGQIYLEKTAGDRSRQFQAVVEGLDRLAIEQHVLVASAELARSLSALPYVTVGSIVSTPVMAYCLLPDVDIAHVHDSKSGQAGLLLRLTRAVPYILTSTEPPNIGGSLWGSICTRAHAKLSSDELHPDNLLDTYHAALDMHLKGPQHADRRQ